MTTLSERPDYGQDGPGVIKSLLLGASVGVVVAFAFAHVPMPGAPILVWGFAVLSAMFVVFAGMMVAYGKRGKFNHRDRMVEMIPWRGDETVLDVGTGRGLLLIGAAKRLTTGKAIGCDIWVERDLTDNGPDGLKRNIELEGVGAKVEVRNDDARKLSLPDASVDVVLSLLCIHNIEPVSGQIAACREIARVLKPGGRALISDFAHTDLYVKTLEDAGLKATRTKGFLADTYMYLRIVEATKPTA